MKPLNPNPPPGVGAVPALAEMQKLAAMLEILRSLASPGGPPPASSSQSGGPEWADHVVSALLKRLTRRVPLPANTKLKRPAEHCPFTGLNHSQIYEAMEPHEDGRPTIRSISLAEPGEVSGAKFYSVQSAIEYMEYLAHRQAAQTQGKKTSV